MVAQYVKNTARFLNSWECKPQPEDVFYDSEVDSFDEALQ